MKKTIIWLVVLIIIIIGIYLISRSSSNPVPVTPSPTATTETTAPQATSTPNVTPNNSAVTVLGQSVGGRDITAYHYGTGTTELLFVGGIHGGYEWNTALVAYQLMDYLKGNPGAIPANVRVTVIPVLNPDGLYKVVGTTTENFTQANVSASQDTVIAGRFNGDNVDLNRNFDCDWQTSGTWQNTPVSGGSAAFSEPESQAIKNYVATSKPTAVIVWYSAAGGVYASNCHTGVSAETNAITQAYALASGYPAHESFDFYATTGDMTNWLARNGITAMSVLLTNHTDTEWSKNLAGVQALFKHYTQ